MHSSFLLFMCLLLSCCSSFFSFFFFLMIRRPPRSTLFPTRRSSDLLAYLAWNIGDELEAAVRLDPNLLEDRKSTRLNSSHTVISYAVFCLKKKKYGVCRTRVSSRHGVRRLIFGFAVRAAGMRGSFAA